MPDLTRFDHTTRLISDPDALLAKMEEAHCPPYWMDMVRAAAVTVVASYVVDGVYLDRELFLDDLRYRLDHDLLVEVGKHLSIMREKVDG